MIQLHDYPKSSASYRVRIALNLKRIAFQRVNRDLLAGAQRDIDYLALNPQGLVPTLITPEGRPLTQSIAIMEWLEERYPDPPLLPAGAEDRAIVRGMVGIMACDIHPLQNLRVREALKAHHGADDTSVRDWIGRWIGDGFDALEPLVARHGNGFAFGNAPTLADCLLVPQAYAANRFGIDVARWPSIAAAVARATALPALAEAAPR